MQRIAHSCLTDLDHLRIWDSGEYETFVDPQLQYDEGKIVFSFLGKKVRGEFTLVRMSGRVRTGGGSDRDSSNWLLIKREDKYADIDWKLKTLLPVK
ncbi:MAG: hypothetical protein PSX80_02725 [bacterium]|nr:hypothetical protein [bacterium]